MDDDTRRKVDQINKQQNEFWNWCLKQKEMSNKIYILQKDLVDARQGREYVFIPSENLYYQKYDPKIDYVFPEKCAAYRDGIRIRPNVAPYHPYSVELNPEWFLLKEDNEISKAKELLEANDYCVMKRGERYPLGHCFPDTDATIKATKWLEDHDYLVFKKDGDLPFEWFARRAINSIKPIFTKEDMRRCFIDARKIHPNEDAVPFMIYHDFDDYLKSLNK
jgi:hypothetical protein